MTRDQAKAIAKQIAQEIEQTTLSSLRAKTYPNCYEVTREGELLTVEIDLLEDTLDYLHLSVSVDDGGLMAWAPATTNVILR